MDILSLFFLIAKQKISDKIVSDSIYWMVMYYEQLSRSIQPFWLADVERL